MDNREYAQLTEVSRTVQAILGEQEFLAVDCGSANGPQQHWWPLTNVGRFMLFEPHPQSHAALVRWAAAQAEPRRWTILNVGLSEHGGCQTLYAHNVPTGSSLLPPDLEHGAVSADDPLIFPLREIPIETQSLGAVCESHGVAGVDLFKIDAQGAELQIIRGLGQPRLGRLLALEAEVISRPTYVGQSSLAAVHDLMHECGLELFDLRPWPARWFASGDDVRGLAQSLDVHERSPSVMHQLHEMDVLYFRSARQTLAQGDVALLRRLLVCYCTYGFFAHALWVTRLAGERGLLAAHEARAIDAAIKQWHRTVHRRPWDARGRAWSFIRRLYHKAHSMFAPRTWSSYGAG